VWVVFHDGAIKAIYSDPDHAKWAKEVLTTSADGVAEMEEWDIQ
jgi:hypothetical protein